MHDGILDLVDEPGLSAADLAELAAQEHAVNDYYENADKLSYHWELQAVEGLPSLLGPTRGTVLDLGCATGTASRRFVEEGRDVLGVDFSLPCLREAKRLIPVLRADASRLPFANESFGGLVSRGLLHHMDDPAVGVREAARVLKPGSPALFADPREFKWLEPAKRLVRRADPAFSDDHASFSLDEYRELLSAHFEIESVETLFPLGIMAVVGLDLLPLPRWLPRRETARAFYRLDQVLMRTPATRAGHLIVVKCKKPS